MNITVLGANGRTGQELITQATAAGHKVVGVVQAEPAQAIEGVRYVVGDATDSNVLAEASKGSDVIVSVLGTSSNKSTLMSDAVDSIIESSKKTKVSRVIVMSSFAVNKDSLGGGIKLMTKMMSGMMNDKANSEQKLMKSNLDWTIVHATMLTNKPLGSGARVVPDGEKITMKHKIARADVAAWILNEAESSSFNKKSVTISQ